MSIGQQTDQTVETLVCHCYEVTEAQIRDTVEAFDLESVEQIALHTGAGTGCTACHCRLRRMLARLPATCAAEMLCATCGFHVRRCACDAA